MPQSTEHDPRCKMYRRKLKATTNNKESKKKTTRTYNNVRNKEQNPSKFISNKNHYFYYN